MAMTPVHVSERAFEDAIECALLHRGPDACPDHKTPVREPPAPPYGDGFAPGSYRRRTSNTDYDRDLCLIPRDVIDFLVATQPRTWNRLKQHHGADVRKRFLSRLAREIERRGALDVLRKGVKDSGCKFQLAYFRPASGLNEGDPAAPRREPLLGRAPASTTAPRRSRAWTWRSSSTGSPSSPPNSRIH